MKKLHAEGLSIMNKDSGIRAINPEHPMVKYAQENSTKFLMLTIWLARRVFPDFRVRITVKDMQEFQRVFAQGGQEPVMAFTGANDEFVISLVDQKTAKQLVMEKGDPNSPNARGMRELMEARKRAQSLADQLHDVARTGNLSKNACNIVEQAAHTMKTLTWEPTPGGDS